MTARRHSRHSALYVGKVMHARRDEHARRTFEYSVYVAGIDLDELDVLDRDLWLFAHDRRGLFALHDRDYATAPGNGVIAPGTEPREIDPRGLAAAHRAVLAAQGLPTPATTRLVTNLRVLDYTFNPVSFFLGYDATGALETVVAEVNNTYGGRHQYVLGPAERLRDVTLSNARSEARTRVGFRVPRVFFVSPFLHGEMDYELWFDAPLDGTALAITMNVARSEGGEVVFVARLAGTRRPFTDRTLAIAALAYPLMTARVIGLIHLEALKLRWLGVPYRRPGPDHRPLAAIPPANARPARRDKPARARLK